MADVLVSNQLGHSVEEYTDLAGRLQASIDKMDEAMQRMVTGAIFGECAPESILRLWNSGEENGGVKGAMESYVSKLYEVAALVQKVVTDAQTVDAGASGEASTAVVVEAQ